MSIENSLERIAAALEALAAKPPHAVAISGIATTPVDADVKTALAAAGPGLPVLPGEALPGAGKSTAVDKVAKVRKPKPVAAAPSISFDKVANAVMDVANNVSRDAAIELMAKFGAQKASEIKPEKFAEVLDAAAKALAAKPAPAEVSANSLI